MVDSTKGDGVVRNIQYAIWRDDKSPSAGYSRELVSINLKPEYYDKMNEKPRYNKDCSTFLEFFEKHAKERPNAPYLGTRERLADDDKGKPVFGEYKWKSWSEIEKEAQNIARGIEEMKLTKEVFGDDKKWKFIGIWAKNRYEWLTTHIANMYFNNTTIGFFDSMGNGTVDYILE